MIIRAWTEPGSEKPLRAEVREAAETGPFGTQITLTDVGQVTALVERWLADIMAEVEPASRPQRLTRGTRP